MSEHFAGSLHAHATGALLKRLLAKDVGFSLEVKEGLSFFGSSEPRVVVSFEGEPSFRLTNSILHVLASELELRSKDEDPWLVVVCKDKGNVHLELVYDGQNREETVERAMSFLRTTLEEVFCLSGGS